METIVCKKGVTVKRIRGNHKGMKVGMLDTVITYNYNVGLLLKKHGNGHDVESFEVVNDEVSTMNTEDE